MSRLILRLGVFAAALFLGLGAVVLVYRLLAGPEIPVFDESKREVLFQDVKVDERLDEREVYAAVYADEGFYKDPSLVTETTIQIRIDRFADPRSIPAVPTEAIADFEAKNKEQISLKLMLSDARISEFISRQEEDAIFSKDKHLGDSWQEFHEKYPGANGMLSFSRIGFNGDHTQAIVYFDHTCGSLCGEGGWLLYRKTNGYWRQAGKGTRWFS